MLKITKKIYLAKIEGLEQTLYSTSNFNFPF